jgi:GR25 family glycosyltransferase involved in LPS biosynthesis
MKSINVYFDKVYCINLTKRLDRLTSATQEFQKNNIIFERYPAIDGNQLQPNNYMKLGEFGCLLSHVSVLRNAKENEYEKILITEDDIEFSENFTDRFFEYIKDLPDDWDMFYLGANHALCNKYETNPPIHISNNIYKVNHAYAAHAYAVNMKCYNLVYKNLIEFKHPVDVVYSKIQSKLNVYLFRPHLAWQKPGYSDIMNSDVNYNFLKN